VPHGAVDPDDRTLGEYVVLYSSLFQRRGWHKFVEGCRLPSDFATNVQALPHRAAHLLNHLRLRGVSVPLTTPPWSQAKLAAACARGSHKSATEYITFLQKEIIAMMQKGQWVLLPYHLVKHLPNLRLSPLGVVPQRDRRPRVIVDYTYSGVNDDTLCLAPPEAMQFGHALQRILQTILHADPRFGPVYLIKVDIADGFYRVWLNTNDIPKLGVIFPTLPHMEPLVAFPLALPMGWKESPPYFCATTETAVDLANRAAEHSYPPPHRLDALADTPPPPAHPAPAPPDPQRWKPVPEPPQRRQRRRGLAHKPVGKFDVFVDDAIGLVQGGRPRRTRLRRVLFASIDAVFRPLTADDGPHPQEPISTKKLSKGDGCWATRKVILGWLIDTVRQTIVLPPHRIERLMEILSLVPPQQKRISLLKWQKLLGELRSMLLGIPGAKVCSVTSKK